MRIVAISDTHGHHKVLGVPPCDVLVHAGDYSGRGIQDELHMFLLWMQAQEQAVHKVMVPGNHDIFCEEFTAVARNMATARGVHFLIDEPLELDGMKFWGSPYTPEFYNWAFMRPRGHRIRQHWDAIPTDTDVLITHGPPHGLADSNIQGEHCGCMDLLERVMIVKPKVHIFGHIHESRGECKLPSMRTKFVNASSICHQHRRIMPPTVIEVDDGT